MELTEKLKRHLENNGWEVEDGTYMGERIDSPRADLIVNLSRSVTPGFDWEVSSSVENLSMSFGWKGSLRVDFGEESVWALAYLGDEPPDVEEDCLGIEHVLDLSDEPRLQFTVEDVGAPPLERLHGSPSDGLVRVTRDWECAVFRLFEGEYLVQSSRHVGRDEDVPHLFEVSEEFASQILWTDDYDKVSAINEEIERQMPDSAASRQIEP